MEHSFPDHHATARHTSARVRFAAIVPEACSSNINALDDEYAVIPARNRRPDLSGRQVLPGATYFDIIPFGVYTKPMPTDLIVKIMESTEARMPEEHIARSNTRAVAIGLVLPGLLPVENADGQPRFLPDPFSCFSEWASDSDDIAYQNLQKTG